MRLRPMSCLVEVRVLQATVAVLALVPVAAGLAGAILGIGVFEPAVLLGRDTDSTGRYLSGLLLAIGVGFWSTVPRIERQGTRFRLLTLIVLTGGLARLSGLLLMGLPSRPMLFGLVMELVVTPALALWRERLEHLCGRMRRVEQRRRHRPQASNRFRRRERLQSPGHLWERTPHGDDR